MKVFLAALMLMVFVGSGTVSHSTALTHYDAAKQVATAYGRWRVKFVLSGGVQKNLVFQAEAKGSGSFLLLDTGVDDKPVTTPQPAAWSQLTNDRVSFSGEVELPLGTCCREIGTLMFKGKFTSSNSISGKLVFVTSVDEEESPYKLRSLVGTFTATRLPEK